MMCIFSDFCATATDNLFDCVVWITYLILVIPQDVAGRLGSKSNRARQINRTSSVYKQIWATENRRHWF